MSVQTPLLRTALATLIVLLGFQSPDFANAQFPVAMPVTQGGAILAPNQNVGFGYQFSGPMSSVIDDGSLVGDSQMMGQVLIQNPGAQVASGYAGSAKLLQLRLQRFLDLLGTGDKAEGWRRYLKLNVLETQVAKGDRADIYKLQDIERRLVDRQMNGLNHPAFNDLRVAMTQHIHQLGQLSQYQFDIPGAVANARYQFRPLSIDDLKYERDLAVYELQLLRLYHKKNSPSRKRAELYYDLQLDENIEALKKIEFELPPARSAGAVSREIRELQEQVKELETKIDAIPEPEETPEPDDSPETDTTARPNGEVQSGDEDTPDTDNVEPPQPDDGDEGAGGSDGEQGIAGDAGQIFQQEQLPEIVPGAVIQPVDPAFGEFLQSPKDKLEQLEKQKEELEEKIESLKDERKKIREEDKDRTDARTKTLVQLRDLNARFEELSKIQKDPYFSAAKETFGKFALRYFYGTSDTSEDVFIQQIETLGEEVAKLNDPQERIAAGRVGNILGVLENTGQVPGLVSAIRARYSMPNIYLMVSGNLINQVVDLPEVGDDRDVAEYILGRFVQGKARLDGNINLSLIDDPDQIHLNVSLAGQINSRTFTKQGPITARANSGGTIGATRDIYANVGGLFAGKPFGSAQLNSTFCGVDCRLRIVQKIAVKEYWKTKFQADQISSERVEKQVLDEFRRETDQAVGQGQAAFGKLKKLRDENRDIIGNFLPQMFARTWKNSVQVVGHKAEKTQLAAHGYPQESNIRPDVSIRLHESMLTNLIGPFFAGKKFTNQEMAEQAQLLLGLDEPPAALVGPQPDDEEGEDGEEAEEVEEENWSITFSNVRPVQFSYDDNAFKVTISGREFEQDGRRIRAGLLISLKFKIKRRGGKLYFVRDGDATVELANPDKKTAAIAGFKSFLESKLNETDQENMVPDPELPENLLPMEQVEFLKESPIAKNMMLSQCRLENGWLYLGWNYSPGGYGYVTVDTPAIWQEVIINEMMNPQYLEPSAPIQIMGPVETQFQYPIIEMPGATSGAIMQTVPAGNMPIPVNGTPIPVDGMPAGNSIPVGQSVIEGGAGVAADSESTGVIGYAPPGTVELVPEPAVNDGSELAPVPSGLPINEK